MIQSWKHGQVPELMKSPVPQRFTVEDICKTVGQMTYEGLQLAACAYLTAASTLGLSPAEIATQLDGHELSGKKLTCFKETK